MTDDIEDAIRGRMGGSTGEKEVVGVAGTPFPGEDKEPLLVTYTIDPSGARITFTNQYEDDVERKVNGRSEYDGYKVKVHKSGSSSAKPFRKQAVTVTVPGGSLPVTNSDLTRISGIIERNRDGVIVEDWFIDMEGRP